MRYAVYASSFADPEDIRRFRRCKGEGKSDQECFKVGDNGIGCWGDDCSEGSGPACALPPETITELKLGRGSPVKVYRGDKSVVVKLKDRMPHIRHLANKARIDLNPDACKALGIKIPAMVQVEYEV